MRDARAGGAANVAGRVGPLASSRLVAGNGRPTRLRYRWNGRDHLVQVVQEAGDGRDNGGRYTGVTYPVAWTDEECWAHYTWRNARCRRKYEQHLLELERNARWNSRRSSEEVMSEV